METPVMPPIERDRIEKWAREYALTMVDEADGTPQYICAIAGAESEYLRAQSTIVTYSEKFVQYHDAYVAAQLEIERLKAEREAIRNKVKLAFETVSKNRESYRDTQPTMFTAATVEMKSYEWILWMLTEGGKEVNLTK